MTSLQLFPKVDHVGQPPPEWGTGRFKEEVDVFVPKAPTWQYSGNPVDQFYKLTQLKLSNIRTNDELVPEPHELPIGPQMINRTFPAEHPYTSHIPRAALFPKFDSDVDPKRGTAARAERPISDEMPAKAYDVQIVHKTKGYGDRREIQSLPKASEKEGLEWTGERGFNQLVKVHDGRQEFYPIPQKLAAPNLQHRGPGMKISLRSANALRNVERDQWQTTYDRNHSGIGPFNPNKLDNLQDKAQFFDRTGFMDNALYPRSINTLDPPRPQEGRIGKSLVPRPPPMKTAAAANAPEDPNYKRMMTLTEKEEDRLWNGKEYVSLPERPEEADRWRELETTAHPDPNLQTLQDSKGQPDIVPYHPAGPPGGNEAQYLESTKRDQDKNFQEIEAQNRWQVLNAHEPSHDISALNHKMGLSHQAEKPFTLYGHEGRYNEERAGLYKTNYSPERLANSMNELDLSGPEIMNTMHSHVDALNLPTRLNHDMKDAFRYSRTLSGSQPNLAGDRRETRELIGQHQGLKGAQKQVLQPTVETARVKVQEGNTTLKESTMGDSYNTQKFLQEWDIGKFSRYEPSQVMSTENQNLHNVRTASSTKSKSVTFSDNIMVAQSLDSGVLRFSSAPTRGSPRVLLAAETSKPAMHTPVSTTQYISSQAEYKADNEADQCSFPRVQFSASKNDAKEVCDTQGSLPPQSESQGHLPYSKVGRKRPATCEPSSEYKNEFSSKGSNFIPSNLQNSLSFSSAYAAQFPKYDIGYKHDSRFDWQPGYGVPRPQTSLLDIQNQFDKSTTRRQFHNQFRESNPDLRDNIIRGKKHNFYGLSGQLLHG